MSTLTTVGYGDVTPQNDAEKIVSMVAMVIGVTVFAYFMGSTASLISAGNATEGAVAQRMAQVRPPRPAVPRHLLGLADPERPNCFAAMISVWFS